MWGLCCLMSNLSLTGTAGRGESRSLCPFSGAYQGPELSQTLSTLAQICLKSGKGQEEE